MAERPLYTLYKNLKAQNYDVPDDYNKFESALTRDGKGGADNRHAIYENLKAQNFDVPSTYERFYSALFEPRSRTSSRAKGGSVPMSAADRARFSAGAAAISASAQQTMNNAGRYNRLKQRKQKQQKDFGRVNLGINKTPYGGDANNVVKDDFAYNPETGKAGAYVTSDNENAYSLPEAEQTQAILDQQNNAYQKAVDTGEIPSAFDVRDKNGNYDLQENIGKNGTYLTEEGAQKQFDKKLADAYARKKEIEALIADDNRQHGNPLLSYGASIGASNGRTAEQSDYRNKLATSLSLITEQIGALEAVKQYPTSSWGEDALKALDNTAFTAKTWDFGLTDFAVMGQMERIKTKMDNNIPLSGSDKMLLKSKLGADAAAALEDEKMGNVYRWTKIAGQSLPFMADFFLTGGYGGITKGISRGALKFAAKRGMGKVGAAILKNTGIVAGDVIGSYAMAGTEQALKTGADIMQRHLGNLYQDEKGDYKFGTFDENGNLLHEGGESIGTALYKGMTSAMVENYTEKLFGHNYGIKKGAVNFMEKHGMNASAEFFKNIGKSGWYTNSKKWMGKFGINGFAEEVMEEEIGIPLHALLDGEGKVSDLLDAKQQLDIIGGMAISVGSMYAMGAGSRPVKGIYNRAQYYRFRNKVNVADTDAQNLMGDNWADIKEKIDNATNEQMGSVLAGILRQRDTMTKEQINAAVNYGVNLMKMRGYNIAKTAEMNAKEITNEPTTPEEQHQADIDNAYSEGHDADDADKHDIQIQHEDQMKTLAAALGISEQQLSAMSDEELESMTGQDDKLDQAIYDYQLSSARYQGVVDDAQDKVDLAAHQAEQRVDMYTDQSRSSVRNATIKASGGLEDYGVYIISGNIATHDDGSIDVSNSDGMILYYDPTTNSVEHADALMFAELGEELPADDVKAQAVADAKENAIKEVAGIIDGTVEIGSQFSVTDADGTEHTYEVLADNGDGTAMITIDGNIPTELVKGENVQIPYSFADLQQMKDAEDLKRLGAAKAQREQMEKERAAQQNQNTEETQPSFDFNQILNDNGNVVLADVLGKDGNTKYPNSQLFLIRDSGAKAKVMELTSDGSLIPHAVNKKDVRTATTMTLDEYKQAFAESSMIEENSGAIDADRGGIEVEDNEEGKLLNRNDDGAQTEQNQPSASVTTSQEDAAGSSESKDTNISANGNENNESLTFEDGTPIPVDVNGEVDLSQTDATHAAEWYDNNLGEDADDWLDGEIKKAKKVLEQAKNKKLAGTKPSELVASKKEKEAAIADAQAHYDSAIAIRDAYNERQLSKVEDTAEGRKELIEKARRKFARLKSAVKDDAEAVSQLYRDTIGSLLHRLYDSTGIDVTDTTPLTAEEYVASNLGAHSLNYEGTDTSKGVKQETGLSREDFAKTQLLAADGKGTTIDALVHSLWENRPSNLESLDTQDIRNALIGVLNSGFKASEARNFVENIRIAQAENILEEQKRAQEDAAYAEQHKAEPEAELKAKSDEKAELKAKSEAKLDNESDNESNDLSNKTDNEKINDNINDNINTPEQNKFPDNLKEGSKTIEVPEDATDEKPLGEQRTKSPFLVRENGKQQTETESDADVEKNKVDDMKVVDNIVGQKTRKAFERLAKMMGANIQWQYSDKLGNGWIQETTDADGNVHRTIFITLDSSIKEGAQFIFGHEMTHQIKKLNPAAYNELTQLVLDTYGSDAFDKAVDKTMQRYSDAGFSGRARDYYAEEVVADSVGEMIRDLNLVHTLAMKMSHPLLAAIHEILQKIKLAFFGTEYNDVTKNIIRSIEQAYVKTAKGEVTNSETGEDVSFSLRQKPEPKKKGVGYKVFVLKDGKLYPPMVANPDGAATPVGVWLDADAAPIAGESKTGRPQVKQGGKGTQGGSGKLAYRPGWHLGVVPYAIQFNRKDAEGNKTLFPKNFVFAEVEYAADVDYQEEARQEGINPSGKYQHSLAGLKHLPTDGYYMYRTNPNPETDPWVITGAMKVNRILTRAEQAELVKNAGREPQQIQEGDIVTDDVVNSINQEIADAPKFSIKAYHGSQASFDKFDHSFMGSGEGAQAYGWGTYVSEVEGIAKAYAKSNATIHSDNGYKEALYKYREADFNYHITETSYKNAVKNLKEKEQLAHPKIKNLEKELEEAKSSGDTISIGFLETALKNWNEVLQTARKEVSKYEDTILPNDKDVLEKAKKRMEELMPERNLYSVDIPEDTGRNYIGWDEPLGAAKIMRLPKVFKANGWEYKKHEMYGLRTDVYTKYANGKELDGKITVEPSTTGGGLYKQLASDLGVGSDKAASEFLSKAGFVGVKVIAQRNTGGNKEGKMNYVIFDENNAQITSHTKFSLRLKSAIEETETNPSDAQKESGNYKKGHIKFGGYDYTIENPKGSTRSGKDADGKEWKVTMHDTYGYIRGKFGKDGDHLDMFINDKADLDNWNGDVFVVDQVNPDGSFDEHKVMYGYDSIDDAKMAYLANYSDGWQGLGNITGASKDEFDKWLDTSNRKLKPFADYAKVKFSLKDIKPVGVGAFGNIYNQFRGKAKAAIEFLKKLGSGEATAALHHHTIGDISLVWGDKKTGLDKILRKHPEVVDNLQSIIDSMEVVQESDNRIKLESPTHFAVVSKEYKGEPREQWLLTAYEKRESLENGKSMDTATSSLGGDTALSQSKESAAKIDNSSETAKENGEKVDVEAPKTFDEFLNHPSLKFSIKNEKQRKAAEDAYEYASKLRPNKSSHYALVDMNNPSSYPEYYEKKVLVDRWRRFYNKAVHNELDDVYKDAWGNYKLFDLDRPFADQVNEVKGDVPDEFNAPDVVVNKNADNESGAEYHEYKQDEPSSITYKDRYKAFKQREANKEKTAGLRKERNEVEDVYKSKSEERVEYNKQLMKEYMDEHGLSSENDIPYDVWDNLRSKSFEKYQDELDSLFNKYKELDKQIKAVAEPRFSLKDEKTLAGVHNITEEKLRKALKLGGFANPSLAVIDTNKSGHNNFGEISFIAPSALLDKRTGKTGGTWITDAYTQRYPSVERQMSEKGSQKFEDWVDSLEYPSAAKAEIKRQTKDVLEDNGVPAWELMYLKEKGIDIKAYDSNVDYRWKEIISDHPTAEDILGSMQNDPELNEKVTSLAKHAIIYPTWEKVSLEVRRKMYEETGVKASPINPQVRKQTKEIFERDYAPSLLNKNGTPKKSDVKKVVEDIVKEHNDTKKYDFYLSKVKASNYVNKNGLYDDYIRWQENKLDEFGTKNRIFRGYTKDGSRKYVPETLENVSKAMREEADGQTNGSEYTSFGSFIAKLASRVDSTDEMRANKDKLSSNKDKEEFYEKWSEVYYDLAKFLYNDVFYGEQRLHDIVLQSDPKKYAKKEYGITLTPTFMKKLDALKNAVQTELKSAYFETKYNRPLRLNEFAAAVVPDNLGEDVRKGIENAGLPMYDYDPNKEGDRSRAFNEAIKSSDNIRFSLKAEKEKIVADAKANGTYMTAPNGEKTKLDAEQWATVRTTNFKNWFGDWENDPENASKVVDENGEPMVVWHGRSAEFNTFEKKEGVRFIMGLEDKVKAEGFFFSPDKGLAEEFASNSSRHRGGKANVVPCFLNIRRPMDLTGEDYDRIYEDVTGWEYMVGMDTQDNLWGIMDEEGMADKIKEKGYDGAIFVEEVDDSYEPTKISYCALDANQIKSAENNNGDFSADNNDIRFSLKSMMAKPEGWKQANKKAIHIAEAIERDPKFSLKNLDGTLIKAGTYFSGGGLVEEGLKGIIDPVLAVEYDEKISGVYRNNFGQHIVTADVRDVDPKELVKQIDGEVEYFHASPVCKNYSQAKSNHAEVELDKETAASTAEFINAIKPKVVTIENVKGYKDSEAMKIITDALDANGYTWDADVYNAADYGGYTNRERLIVRAVRDGKLPEKPKKMARKSGWYEAVADIIPTLTEKKNGVAPWMDIRLKADGIDWRNINKPLYVMGSAYADGKIPHAFANELLPTLRTKSGDVIVMPDGKVYRALGRVLARVSGVSDDYKMPFSENLSHTIIGNGIPTQLTEHVIAPLLQNTLRPTTPDEGSTKFSLRYDQFEHDLNQWKKDNNLPKDAKRPTIPQRNAGESAVDFLRRVDEYRKQMALWKTAPTYEQYLLSDDTALGEFNRELQRGSVLKRIAFQDSMLAIRKAQEAIMKEVGVDRLNMAEDAYTAENRSHGKGKNEFEEYNNEFLQPLRKAYHQMKKVLGDSYDNVRIYMMAKHGLERDAQMAFKKSLEADYEDVDQRSAAYKAYKGDMNRIINDSDLEFGRVDFTTWRQRDNALRVKYSPSYMDYRYDKNGIAYDYSGLSALFDGSDFEEAAHKLVKDIESKYVAETHDLWDATNAATKKILRDGYKAGMMSKDTYQYVRDMYSHYIPLRGWDGTTADQVWDYIGGGKGAFNQTLKTAHGRTSIADDPITYIENMAESGILLNNKNWVKQHLMLLAQNHPTSLLTLSKAWYVKSVDDNGNEEWIPATPQITSQMDSNQVKAAIDAFEKKMEKMAQTGDATQKRDGLNIAYPQTNSEEREHEVRVMKDGEEYVIYVNGDPQLAQAMNNTRAHRVREIQSGKLDRAAAWLGRKMAAAYTSLSPLFIPSNYFRDLTMTLASTAIREDAKYNYLLRKNLATSWNLGFVLRDYQNGKLRDKVNNGNATPKEQMFYDFMMNGGETGFVSSLDVEDLKKKFKNDLKDLDRWKANPVKVGHTIMDGIEFLNRAIEDSNRFAVYMTSIQYGRSIDEAVNDAKDVTLNFNRKGTGEYGWQMIRNLYLFINPAVQSLQTLGALVKHHPFKFTAVTASWLASGVLVPIVNAALMSMLGGDDDKDKYWQFTKWDRRNNLIMWVPFTHEYIKIPLAQEFRAFYGVGDMIASKMMGGELAEESWSQYAEDLLGQVVDMLPLDPTGYDGNIAVSLMPNAIRPIFELAFNVDFTGKPLFKDTEYNKYDPNFTKAYVGTPDWLVRASKMVNSIGNDYPDVQQNSIDAFGDPRYNLNNPAVVDHVLSSYLGGAYTMGSQVLGVLTKSLNDPKEIKVADIPLFSKFVSNPDDRPVTKKQGDEFWNMKENHDRAANTLSKLKKQAKVDGDYSMLERFYGSEEYKQYKQDDAKVKKYEEDKKKERAEESGEEYRPHKLNAEDIYKAHATPKDDFEDLKLKQLYTKLNGFKTSYDLLVDTAPSQSDGYYNTNKAAIDAIDEISLDKQEISELKKGFLDDGKDAYNAEDMKQIRDLRKKILSVLEKANKVVVANQKAKTEK
jgi:site-specific DNA-cytosine methylase